MFILVLWCCFASVHSSSLSLRQFGAVSGASDFASAKQNARALELAFIQSSNQHLPVVVNSDEV
jgi:hypothetical protein